MSLKSYVTVKAFGEDEFVERRSRFIGAAIPIKNEADATEFIAERRSKYWNATHNVYAYSLRDGSIRRFSDDSEPQGTAGMPTLDVLTKSEVTDVCVVTTRYFGGVLLGAGGLVRAYSHAASIALSAAGAIMMVPVFDCILDCDYHMYGKLNAMLSDKGAMDITPVFTDGVRLNFCVSFEQKDSLCAAVVDVSNGKCHVETVAERYRESSI